MSPYRPRWLRRAGDRRRQPGRAAPPTRCRHRRQTASTTPASSTTPAGWRWWPTCTAAARTTWWSGPCPRSSTWPTGEPPAVRRTAVTAPESSCRCPTPSTVPWSTSTCPRRATMPPASPSCRATPARRSTPGGRWPSWPTRRACPSSDGGTFPSGTARWGRSPRRPCPRCTRCSWRRGRTPPCRDRTRLWPWTDWPSSCASAPSTRSIPVTWPRCRPGPSSTREC